MNRQAIVGLFAIIAIAGLFGILFVLNNVGTQGRYKMGVHFKTASGLHKGALVYESGVNVGIVDALRLLDDFTVQVVLGINNSVDIPKGSRYVIAVPVTGDVTLEIVPPHRARGAVALEERQILPLAQQPEGTTPATITDLLQQGQTQVARIDHILAELEVREPKLLDTLQTALTNANSLTRQSSDELTRLSSRFNTMADTLQVALQQGSANTVDLTARVDDLVKANGGNLTSIVASFQTTARALNETVDSVRDLAGNKEIRQNLIDTTKGLAATTQTFGKITDDFHNVTGNPQTQAQLRDTVANIDAASQKLNTLLRSFGATSSVYGVDANATPAPGRSASPSRSPAPGPTLAPGATRVLQPGTDNPADLAGTLKSRIAAVARNLVAVQIRLAYLDRANTTAGASPLLTSDRGPQSDVNLIALPQGRTSVLTGINDLGAGTQTYNFLAQSRLSDNLRIGGGILYSRLGLLGQYTSGPFGIEARAYDVRRPTLDLYGKYRLSKGLDVFGGERDLSRIGRRTVFGLELRF